MVPAVCNSAWTGTDPEGQQAFVPWVTLVFDALWAAYVSAEE